MRDEWEKHLAEQARIPGMPGLKAMPCFEAGFEAGFQAGALAMRERIAAETVNRGFLAADEIDAIPVRK